MLDLHAITIDGVVVERKFYKTQYFRQVDYCIEESLVASVYQNLRPHDGSGSILPVRVMTMTISVTHQKLFFMVMDDVRAVSRLWTADVGKITPDFNLPELGGSVNKMIVKHEFLTIDGVQIVREFRFVRERSRHMIYYLGERLVVEVFQTLKPQAVFMPELGLYSIMNSPEFVSHDGIQDVWHNTKQVTAVLRDAAEVSRKWIGDTSRNVSSDDLWNPEPLRNWLGDTLVGSYPDKDA